jgi:outer membrane receptor protein involved in Fe transport
MVNLPVGDTFGIRLSGYYLDRDGYTLNLFDNSRIDDRHQYALRGSLRWEPTPSTTLDLMVQYFNEDDHRMRIQKQLCQRDPTGILGCLNASRGYETTNANTTAASALTSREFFAIQGLPTAFALGSFYGTDQYAGVVNPADPRIVNTDYTPTYRTSEWIVQGSLSHEFDNGISVKLSGNWQDVKLDSSQDYNLSVANRAGYAPGLGTLAFAAGGGLGAGLQAYLRPIANALIPNGPTGVLCTSLPEATNTGIYGGHSLCSATPQDLDRSDNYQKSWSAEGIVSSKWDGMFNFLLGGIYSELHLSENSYYVNAFPLDYASGVIGALSAAGSGAPPTATTSYYLGSPFFRSNTDDLRLKSYGIFGEAYFEFNDKLKLTLGLRYNHDQKAVTARTTLLFDAKPSPSGVLVPQGSPSLSSAVNLAALDFNPAVAGNQLFAVSEASFGEWTGRAVLDWKVSPDSLIYLSYSRGYKSGGINPPLSVGFGVPTTFAPEFVNAFEIGSKNQFGALTLNLTGFYYQYKDLQLSRIVNRTSVNDNVSANIWGIEAEAIVRPSRHVTVNMNFSYLNTEVSSDKFLANPRDFGAGRTDAVIIKDITNASNCAVASTSGNAAGVNAFVNTVNSLINSGAFAALGVQGGAGLRPTTAFPAGGGINSTGAFSLCSVLGAAASGGVPGLNPAVFGGISYHPAGILSNIRGNSLPGAPDFKFSAGVQYEAPIGNMSLTPRLDVTMTGESSGNIFGGPINSIDAFWQMNAQIQLDGPDKKWFVRAFIQNVLDDNPVTGLYVTDQSSGLFTNIFTLEPRRFGVAAGFKF